MEQIDDLESTNSESEQPQDSKQSRFRPWYLFHDSCVVVKEFIFGPKQAAKLDIDPLTITQSLIEANPNDASTISICERLVKIHRQTENTKARKRLEKWATKVITCYLLAIAALFVVCYAEHPNLCFHVRCPQPVMEFLLTTTTVNVLGLVVIVLNGYFQEKENKKIDK